MEELEFARMLATGSRIPKASGTSASQTHTLIGRVDSVSEDGLVAYVDLHGYTVEGDEEGQAVPFDNYATNISEGDDVIVQLVGEDGAGKTGYVVAAAGRGQQLTYRVDEIDEAARRATASAETAAQKAEEATASAETASEKAGQAISDAASAKAAADAAQADAKKANDAASKAQSSADSAATAASDAQASADTADANATKAIADAASASDAAAKAQTSADDAAKDASAASTSAVDAGKAAATAQAAADAAQADVDETQKWFYHDTLGAHVLSSDGDNYRADVTPTALGVVDTGTGHTVASFGKDGVRFDAGYDQTIGSDDAYVRFHADTDELEIRAKSVVIGSTDVTDAITDARATADKAQTDATNAQSTIDSYKTSNDKAVADAKAAGTTAQSQLNSYKSSNDQAVAAAKKAGTDAQSDLDAYRGTTDQRLDELSNIADNAIETWYLKGAPTTSNAPAKDWTTDALKKRHAGDLYMDTDTGYSYRWSGSAWVQVKDSDVTKALKEIESVKTTYATKSELTATDTELSGKVSDALTTAKSYTDSSVEQEVTARNAAIKAQADSISLDVSRTYTRSDTFSAYQTDADGRIATANSNASTAVSTAQTAASDAATAKTDASSAVSTANSANTKSESAVSTANSAASTANAAKSTADAAKSSAGSAVSTANAANSTAGTAKSTADAAQAKADDAWARTLRVEVMSAPADAAGDTSLLTAYAFRGGELLSDETVAKMGLLAWYVGGSRVATGGTYTCAAGTAVECRLEA